MVFSSGLDEVVAAGTALSNIDGQQGTLVYRGYYATELAKYKSFEEVAHLLWYGHLPDTDEREAIGQQFRADRALPSVVRNVLDQLPTTMDIMSALRTGISALSADKGMSQQPSIESALRITSLAPTIVAYHYARTMDRKPVEPDDTLSHVKNYLYMLTGQIPSPGEARALEAYLILTMEHGMNASTFAARVITSTQSDMVSAITGALGAMKGPLHGGAPSGVLSMIEAIQTKDRALPWLDEQLAHGQRLMGFGHRVYKTTDPRAEALRAIVKEYAATSPWFDLAVHIEEMAQQVLQKYKPGRQLHTNVEYWAAAIMKTVNMAPALFSPTFSCSRCVGWTAHTLEQLDVGRLIRPQSVYEGPAPTSL